MGGETNHIYEFGPFRIDLTERQLRKDEELLALTPKAFDVLALLIKNARHLVEKEELMQLIWPNSYVEEANVARIVHTLRKALGEDQNGNKYIETVPKKGYRFVAELTEQAPSEARLGFKRTFADASGYKLNEISRASEPKFKQLIRSRSVIAGAGILLLAIACLFLFRANWNTRPTKRLEPETLSGEALQNFAQGKLLVERRHPGDYDKALEMFERAIQLDPNYVSAYAGKADAKVVSFWKTGKHEDISVARTAVRKALELDDSNSYAHTLNCRILTTYDWDHEEAEKECRKAVELGSNDHEAFKELAFLLNTLGRETEALAAIDRAIAISPTSFNKRSRGLILYHSRSYDEAIAQFEQVEQTDPLYTETTKWLLWCHMMKEDYSKALGAYVTLKSRSGATAEEIDRIRQIFARNGWESVLQTMSESKDRGLFLAGTLAKLGEKDKAFEILDEMLKQRTVMVVTIAREPTLDQLRDDPRFENILKRIGLDK
jgi:DNA-binding winged helix-turn-helix (wHTH) protein/Tfp pilus assembly protein PilF